MPLPVRRPKTPSKLIRDRYDAPPNCDPRLPQKALEYRVVSGLLSHSDLAAYNVTAWLIRKNNIEDFIVARNTTIAQLKKKHGPAADPKAEVGFHSEMLAHEKLTAMPGFSAGEIQVLQIFTEREPCRKMCRYMLQWKHKGVPVYYYLPENSGWWDRNAALSLIAAYQL